MTEHEPTPLERAVARMMAMEQIDQDLARRLDHRTVIGRNILLQEHACELGHVANRRFLLTTIGIIWAIIAVVAIVGFWAGWWTWEVTPWAW